MKKYKKISFIFVIAVMVCLTLVACADKPSKEEEGTTVPAALPEFNEPKNILSEEATKEIIKDLIGENSEDITGDSTENQESITDKIINFEAFTAENIDREKFLAYVNACKAQGYELIGEYTENGVRMAALSAESDKMILVTLKDGIMTAIMYQIELPEEIVYEWPTAMLRKFGLSSLTQPNGSQLESVQKTTVNGLEKHDSVSIILNKATRDMFDSIISAARSSGYSITQNIDNTDEYYGVLILNEEELSFCASINTLDNRGTQIWINITNESQFMFIEKGKNFNNVYPEATYTITTTYKDKTNNGGKDIAEDYEFMHTQNISSSYNANGAIEYYGETPEENTAIIFRLSDRHTYRLTNAGHNLAMEENGAKTLWRFLDNPLQGLFNRSYDQTKTGIVKNIAGIDCVEYIGTVTETYYVESENNLNGSENERTATYKAKYYIDESSGLLFGYIGKYRPEDEYETTIMVTEFIPNYSIVDKYLDLPADGEFFNEFPSEEIYVELGIRDFMPEVSGAEGYYVRYNYEQHTNHDGSLSDLVLARRYIVKGIDRTEYDNYQQLLLSNGFNFGDGSYYVYLDNLDRISIYFMYESENANELVFYFDVNKYEPNPIFDNSITIEYEQDTGLGDINQIRFNISDKGILISNYNTESGGQINYSYYKWLESEKIYRLYGFSDWNELDRILSETFSGQTFNKRTLAEYLSQDPGTSYLFNKKNSTWEKTGEGGVNGMSAEIYKVTGDSFTYYMSVEYGIPLKLVDQTTQQVYYEVKSITEYNPDYVAFGNGTPVFGGEQEIFTFGVDEYLRDFSQQNEYSKEFFAENYSDFRLVKVCGNVTNDEFLSFKQSVDDKNYRVLENYIDYKYDDNDNRTDEVIRARLYLTDSVDYVLEITYDLGCLHVLEYRLKHGAEDFFGDELNAENEYNDYYSAFGDGRYTVNREETVPYHNISEKLTIFADGNNFYDGHKLIVAQEDGSAAKAYNISQFGQRTLKTYEYDTNNSITSKNDIFNDYVPYELKIKRNMTRYKKIGTESYLGRECTVYEGVLSNRGSKSDITVYVDNLSGVYLKLKITGSTNVTCYFSEIIIGDGYCDLDVAVLPKVGTYKLSDWKDSYYGYDFVPRVKNFTEFEFINGNMLVFRGEVLTLGEYDTNLNVNTYDYGKKLECYYNNSDGTQVKFDIYLNSTSNTTEIMILNN